MPDLLARLNRSRKNALVAVAALMIPASALTAAVSVSGRGEPAAPSPAPSPAAASPAAIRISATTASPGFEFRCGAWVPGENTVRCTVRSIGGFRDPVTLSCRGEDPRPAACSFHESPTLTPPPNGAASVIVSDQHAMGYGTYSGEIVARGGGLMRTVPFEIRTVEPPPLHGRQRSRQ
jgi:hypothetical protein